MKKFTIESSNVKCPAHCASILSTGDDILIVYYMGPECSDAQCVQLIQYKRNGTLIKKLNLMSQTGNPILFKFGSSIHLVCSYFNDVGPNNEVPYTRIDRWKYCSLWDFNYLFDVNGIITPTSITKIPIEVGYVARCAPIEHKIGNITNILIPLYREKDPHGLIVAYNNKWTKLGIIGDNIADVHHHFGRGGLIQPSIWYDGRYKVLCRDVTKNNRAWYSESLDCRRWSNPIQTNVWNDNNSIVVINNSIGPLIIWNDGPGRSILNLGYFKNYEAISLMRLNGKERASYPNYCWDSDGNLHIVYTEGFNITYCILEKLEIESLVKN